MSEESLDLVLQLCVLMCLHPPTTGLIIFLSSSSSPSAMPQRLMEQRRVPIPSEHLLTPAVTSASGGVPVIRVWSETWRFFQPLRFVHPSFSSQMLPPSFSSFISSRQLLLAVDLGCAPTDGRGGSGQAPGKVPPLPCHVHVGGALETYFPLAISDIEAQDDEERDEVGIAYSHER